MNERGAERRRWGKGEEQKEEKKESKQEGEGKDESGDEEWKVVKRAENKKIKDRKSMNKKRT